MPYKTLVIKLFPLLLLLMAGGFIIGNYPPNFAKPGMGYPDDTPAGTPAGAPAETAVPPESQMEGEWYQFVQSSSGIENLEAQWPKKTIDQKRAIFYQTMAMYNDKVKSEITYDRELKNAISKIQLLGEEDAKKFDTKWNEISTQEKEMLLRETMAEKKSDAKKDSDNEFIKRICEVAKVDEKTVKDELKWETLKQNEKVLLISKFQIAIEDMIFKESSKESSTEQTSQEKEYLIKIAEVLKLKVETTFLELEWEKLDHAGKVLMFYAYLYPVPAPPVPAAPVAPPEVTPPPLEEMEQPLEVEEMEQPPEVEETGWRGGEGQGRLGTGLRDSPGSNSGVWYFTGPGGISFTQVGNMARARAKEAGVRKYEGYMWRFMPEP